jgi:uncharacterized delta-60 repeat protein
MKKTILLISASISFGAFSQSIQLDPTFGPSGNPTDIGLVSSGVSVNVLPHYSQIRTVSITPSGDIVSFGSIYDTNGLENFGISKYTSNGSLDNSFGNNGLASYSWYQADTNTHYFGDRIYSGGVQSTGKILAVGFTEEKVSDTISSGYTKYRESCILRLNSDGSVDSTFGTDGKITGNYNGHTASTYHDILLQSNDGFYSILDEYVPSFGFYRSYVTKHKSDGTLDSSFAINGITTNDDMTGWGLSVQNDGKILFSGYGWYGSPLAVIMRFNTDGNIDSTFGTNGVVTQDYGNYNFGEERFSQVFTQPDGKIVVSGWAGNYKDTTANSYSSDMIVARYNINGLLDSTFGTNGMIVQDILSSDPNEGRLNRTYAGGVLLTDGSFLFNTFEKSNYSHTGESERVGFFKYTSNGILDNAFGNNGYYRVTLLTDTNDYMNIRMDDMLLLPNNKILLGGSVVTNSGSGSSYTYVSNILLQLSLNNSTSTDEIIFTSKLKVFPNPSSDFIHIQNEDIGAIKEVNILSIDGRKIEGFMNYRQSNEVSIDISSLPTGTFIVKVVSNKGDVSSSTFVKK